MNEVMNRDVNEYNSPAVENYKNIKPQEGTTLKDAEDYLEEQFKEQADNNPDVGHVNDGASREAKESETTDDHQNDIGTSTDHPRYVITRNECLENDKHPITEVPFKRKVIELPGNDVVEAVVPEFDSKFNARIPEDMYRESDKVQFKECNKQLLSEIEKNPELRAQFTDEQIEQIRDGVSDGTAPDGYVWHHDAEPGVIQLVDSDTHSKTGHTGGRCLWGGGTDNR